MDAQFELVSKLQAARRQLREAIRMFFEKKDIIAIHTLATASHQVLFDLLKEHNQSQTEFVLLNPDSPFIRDEKKKEWTKTIRGAQNFFKHGASDPNKTYKFYFGATPFYIFDATLMFSLLTSEYFYESHVFKTWCYIKYPEFIENLKIKEEIESRKKTGLDPNDFEMMRLLLDKVKKRGQTFTFDNST